MFKKVLKLKKTKANSSKSITKLSKIELISVIGGRQGDPVPGMGDSYNECPTREGVCTTTACPKA